MRTNIIIVIATLALGAISINRIEAQTADTLRRTLRVMTSEQIQLERRSPMSFTLNPPSVTRAKSRPTDAMPLSGRHDVLALLPLEIMSPLPSHAFVDDQIGYIDLRLGMSYNAGLGVGLRPVNTNTDQLDLIVNGAWTDAKIFDAWRRKIQGIQTTLGARFQHRSESTTWGIYGKYSFARRNYYGILVDPSISRITSREESVISSFMDEYLRSNTMEIGADFASNEGVRQDWHYRITPRLTYMTLRAPSLLKPDVQLREVRPMADLSLFRQLEVGDVGIDSRILALSYSGSKENVDIRGTSRMIMDLKPFWEVSEEGWRVKLSGALSFYRDAVESSILITPQIEGRFTLGDYWKLAVDIKGGLEDNALSQLIERMPYLYADLPQRITRKPVDARLKIDGLVMPNLSLGVRVGYTYLHNSVNFMAVSHRSESGISGVGFVSTFASGKHFDVGASISYRNRGKWTFLVNADYHQWGAELYDRPSVVVDAQWHYHPSKQINLQVGYELQAGIKQGVNINIPTTTMITLDPMHILKVAASYTLDRYWAFNVNAQVAPSGMSRLYYQYPPQRFMLGVGASLRF